MMTMLRTIEDEQNAIKGEKEFYFFFCQIAVSFQGFVFFFFCLLLVGYIHLITSGAAAAFIFMYSILILHFAFFFSKCLPQSLKRMQKKIALTTT